MSEATCAVLATIFPLVLVTGVLERRSASLKIRRLKLYRRVSLVTFAVALMGTIYAVIGVAMGGFVLSAGVALWALFGISIFGLGFTLLASLATAEVEEDAEDDDGAGLDPDVEK